MALIKQYHKDTDTTYVYESISYWDEEKKQSRSKRRQPPAHGFQAQIAEPPGLYAIFRRQPLPQQLRLMIGPVAARIKMIHQPAAGGIGPRQQHQSTHALWRTILWHRHKAISRRETILCGQMADRLMGQHRHFYLVPNRRSPASPRPGMI